MDVRHDEQAQRFVITEGGHESYLAYRRLPGGVLDYRSTFVPDALRGRGIAGRLAAHALDYARSQGARVVPSCSYVAEFIERHPEYRDLISAGSSG